MENCITCKYCYQGVGSGEYKCLVQKRTDKLGLFIALRLVCNNYESGIMNLDKLKK